MATKCLRMQDDAGVDNDLSAADAERLMHRVMWRQGRLSLAVSAIFIALLIFIPLFNMLRPTVAAESIFGFPLTWLLLGVLFYPVTWILSAYFVKRSDQLESEISKEEAK